MRLGPLARSALGLLALSACASSGGAGAASTRTQDSTPGLNVVATTTQLADFVSAIGGNRVKIHRLLAPNVDPHDFEPSPADLEALIRAQLIVRNGVNLEKWFDATITAAGAKGTVLDASQGITLRRGAGGEADPHIWHNPRNAMLMVASIERALEKAEPAAAGDFRRNLASYTAQLEQLDRDIQAEIATLTNKHLVTDHDSLGYYIDRYGLVFVGPIIPSFDTSAQLSATQIGDLVQKIRQTGTKAVFAESSLPTKTADAIAAEAGVKVVAGQDALYGDSLGPAGSDGDTYLKMERHNTKVIVDNLR